MGEGAKLTVINKHGKDIDSYVTNVKCMYDHGDEGSHLDRFHNVSLKHGEKIENVYIEAKNKFGTECFGNPAYFTLIFTDSSGSVGKAKFDEANSNYHGIGDPEDRIAVKVYSVPNPQEIEVIVLP